MPVTRRPAALIIDDDADDALLISLFLRRHGYDPRCESPRSLADIRKMLTREAWDVVICDYSIPGISASDVAVVISESGACVPLIVVSGVDREAGGHEFALKDDLSGLLPAIERARACRASPPPPSLSPTV